MKYTLSYFSLCLKRAAHSLVPIIASIALLAAALFMVAAMSVNIDKNDTDRQKVKIGIAGDIHDTYLGIGITALAEIDDIGFSVEFKEMTEHEAEAALRDAEISAYVFVPDNYIDDLVSGKDVVLSFVMTRSTSDISAILMGEIARIISPLVTESESGIYAMYDYGSSKNDREISDKVNTLNIKYITEILDRSSSYDVENLGINSLSVSEYYACGIITFFVLIFSVSCCPLFADKHISMGRLLLSRGVKAWQMVIGEYITYVLVIWSALLAIGIGGALVCGRTDIGLDPDWFARLPLIGIPCILMTAALHFLIYEATDGIITGVLAQFVSAVAMGYISGCFYPYYMFPESVQRLSSVLPSGLIFELLRESMAMRACNAWIGCIFYALLFLSAAILVRGRRIMWEAV